MRQISQKLYKLATTIEDAVNLNNNPRLIAKKLISESLILYELVKAEILLDRPLYIGFISAALPWV